MKLLRKLFQCTLIYKIYNVINTLKDYIIDYDYVSESFYSEAFEKILNRYLNLKIKKDWIGRLYGVINPNLDINGKVNFSNIIIEIDGENTNSNTYVNNWIYGQMNLVKYAFKLDESAFFDYLGCDITHVGPKDQDNYLVVFYLISQKAFMRAVKSMLKHLSVYTVLGVLAYLFLF